MWSRVRVQFEPLDPLAPQAELWGGRPGVGAVVSFIGLMRDFNVGQAVQGMTLEHYPGMTEKALQAIVDQAGERWNEAKYHEMNVRYQNQAMEYLRKLAKEDKPFFLQYWPLYPLTGPRTAYEEYTTPNGGTYVEKMKLVDRWIGELMAEMDALGIADNTLVIVMGAWGHRLEHSKVFLNGLLARHGYLRFKRSPSSLAKRLIFRLGISKSTAERLAHRLNLWKLFHYKMARGKRAAVTGATFLSYNDVDWSRTRAYALGLNSLYVNRSGREGHGIVLAAQESLGTVHWIEHPVAIAVPVVVALTQGGGHN